MIARKIKFYICHSDHGTNKFFKFISEIPTHRATIRSSGPHFCIAKLSGKKVKFRTLLFFTKLTRHDRLFQPKANSNHVAYESRKKNLVRYRWKWVRIQISPRNHNQSVKLSEVPFRNSLTLWMGPQISCNRFWNEIRLSAHAQVYGRLRGFRWCCLSEATTDQLINKGRAIPPFKLAPDALGSSKILKALCSLETKDVSKLENV